MLSFAFAHTERQRLPCCNECTKHLSPQLIVRVCQQFQWHRCPKVHCCHPIPIVCICIMHIYATTPRKPHKARRHRTQHQLLLRRCDRMAMYYSSRVGVSTYVVYGFFQLSSSSSSSSISSRHARVILNLNI